jgi:multiple sugar transport system substrate-binding protein
MKCGRSLLAMVVMAVLTAAACGSTSNKNGGEDTLTFWTAEDEPQRVAATRAIVDRFEQKAEIRVNIVPVAEDELRSRVDSASATGSLPDVFGAMSLALVHSLAADGITDTDAAADVIDALGPQTFSERGLELVQVNGEPIAVPSDSWTQLLLYRKDLFDKAGLAPPTTFEAIRTAALTLTGGGRVGIVAGTNAGESFTQQSFEHLALANGCELVDATGKITLDSGSCVDTFAFYVDLIRNASVQGEQDADSTRAAYLAGDAAMAIWSSFILDELAGLRDDVLPSCPECRQDISYLSKSSGIVTAIEGPDAVEPSQFGEVTSFAIARDSKTDEAKKFVEFMMNDGYVDWLALAPEGKVPLRMGDQDEPTKFADAWTHLDTGQDRSVPLSDIYPPELLQMLTSSVDTMSRWGFPQEQERLVAAQLSELPVPNALAAALDGTLQPVAAAAQAQADMERIARPFR